MGSNQPTTRYRDVKVGEYTDLLSPSWTRDDGTVITMTSGTIAIHGPFGIVLAETAATPDAEGLTYGWLVPTSVRFPAGAESVQLTVEWRGVPTTGGSPLKSPDIALTVQRSLTS